MNVHVATGMPAYPEGSRSISVMACVGDGWNPYLVDQCNWALRLGAQGTQRRP
jgi:hypothetical protein